MSTECKSESNRNHEDSITQDIHKLTTYKGRKWRAHKTKTRSPDELHGRDFLGCGGASELGGRLSISSDSLLAGTSTWQP